MTERITVEQYRALVEAQPAGKKSKFRNVRRAATLTDPGSEYVSPVAGRRIYDSKAEARRAAYHDMRVRAGEILAWVPQVSFPLPGGGRMQVDFFIRNLDGSIELEDVKGAPPTRHWLHKRELMRSFYGLEVQIVRSSR